MQEILEIFFLEVIFEVFLLFGSYRFLISEDCLKNLKKIQNLIFSLFFIFTYDRKPDFLIFLPYHIMRGFSEKILSFDFKAENLILEAEDFIRENTL